MNPRVTRRKFSELMALALVLLGLAVFFWGLGYKLSLYDLPGSPSTHMAQAKLLSQKERPPAAQGLEQFSAKAPPFSVVVIAVFLIAAACFSAFSIQIIRTLFASHVGLRRCADFLSTVFAFRPPPVSLRYN
ncbi:MAG TPA: hypothetical protein VI386_27380 [Candidatus Sulfotelmatobacter sp.]